MFVSVMIVKIIVVEMVMVSVAEVFGIPLTTASEPYTHFSSIKLFMIEFSCLLASRHRHRSKRPRIKIKKIEKKAIDLILVTSVIQYIERLRLF